MDKKKESLRETIKHTNIYTMRVPEERGERKEQKKIFKEVIVENYWKKNKFTCPGS